MKYLLFIFILIILSCSRTEETETVISTFTIAGYDFEVVEYKTILKKTGEVTEYYIDTLLIIDCKHCREICGEDSDHQDYRR